MANMASGADVEDSVADLTKKLKIAKKRAAKSGDNASAGKFSLGKFLTPFKTACLAFSMLVLFNIVWAMAFGNKMGGQPVSILNIDWVRSEKTDTFIPDFGAQTENGTQFVQNGYNPANSNTLNANSMGEMPRIKASGNSKIIHLPTNMAEAQQETFENSGKLTKAPIEDVVQFSKFGKLPKIGVLGQKPSEVYARPAPKFDGRPRIAIMITGLGIHHDTTKNAIDGMPGAITFAFSPYGQGLQDWINRAREKGHEVVLQTPMEPFDYPDNDPGPSTLLADGEVSINLDRFKWVLSRITGYIGITNFMGAKFTSKEKAITPILKELKARGLYYIENGVLHRSKVSKISQQMNLGYSKVDVIIDDKKTIEQIENSLERIEQIATTTGIAFAIGSTLPATIEHVKIWANTLEAKGYQLVPVSVKIKNELKTNIASENMPATN